MRWPIAVLAIKMFCNATFPDGHTQVVNGPLYDSARECQGSISSSENRRAQQLNPIHGNPGKPVMGNVKNCWCDD